MFEYSLKSKDELEKLKKVKKASKNYLQVWKS